MGIPQVRAFLDKVRSDEALKQRFRSLYEASDLPALSVMAKELGFTITKEDYDAAVAEDLKKLTDSGHLSQADLQAIVGGAGDPSASRPTVGPFCFATMGETCAQSTIGLCKGPGVSNGTSMCSNVTCC